MKQRDLASVSFAVIGVYLIASPVAGHVWLFGMRVINEGYGEEFWVHLVSAVVGLTIGGTLVGFRHQLAARLFPAETGHGVRLSAADLQAILLSVLGVYLVVQGATEAIAVFTLRSGRYDLQKLLGWVGADLLRVIFGLVLLVWYHSLVKSLRAMRSAGSSS